MEKEYRVKDVDGKIKIASLLEELNRDGSRVKFTGSDRGGVFFEDGESFREILSGLLVDTWVLSLIYPCSEADFNLLYRILKGMKDLSCGGVVDKEGEEINLDEEFSKQKIDEALEIGRSEIPQEYVSAEHIWFRPKNYNEGDSYLLVKRVNPIQRNVLIGLCPYVLLDTGSIGDIASDPVILKYNKLADIMSEGFIRQRDGVILVPSMKEDEWKAFVERAQEFSIADELIADETIKLDGDEGEGDGESEDADSEKGQYQGNRWGCVVSGGLGEAISDAISECLEKGKLSGDTVTDYTLDKPMNGNVYLFMRTKSKSNAIGSLSIVAQNGERNELVSAYPVLLDGVVIEMKIQKCMPWTNGLEGWIEGTTDSDRELIFFDTHYALHKDEYKEGSSYKFLLSALAYSIEEFDNSGFSFEGEKAVSFKAKVGEEVKRDENGEVLPVHFSTEELCAFFQVDNYYKDDAQFITKVGEVQQARGLGNSFLRFNITLRDADCEKETLLPCYIKKTKKNERILATGHVEGLCCLMGRVIED